MPEKDPAKQVSSATWGRIAADIERLALTNEHLMRTIDDLERTCLETFNENERLKTLLRHHNIQFPDPPS